MLSLRLVETEAAPIVGGEGDRLAVVRDRDGAACAYGWTAGGQHWLQLPELANPSFDECRMEFTLGGNRVQTPVLSLKGAAVQMTGKGTMSLATSALDYDMNLALAKSLVDKIGVKELRAAFRDRGDGFAAVDFKVTGTSDRPQTDLAARIGKAAATQALKDQAGKLFGKKKPF